MVKKLTKQDYLDMIQVGNLKKWNQKNSKLLSLKKKKNKKKKTAVKKKKKSKKKKKNGTS